MKPRHLPELWEVEWVDSSTNHGWAKDREAAEHGVAVITSVGFLIESGEDRIVLTKSTVHMLEIEREEDVRFDCCTAIPKVAVRKMTRLRKARL